MSPSLHSRRSGFSLLELLVVVAIIALLLAFLLPAVQRVRQQAEATKTINSLKQVCLAVHFANDVYRRIPSAFGKFGPLDFPASFHVHLLPFVEQEPLLKQYMQQKGGGDTKNALVQAYLSLEDPSNLDHKTPGVQNMAGNLRVLSAEGFYNGVGADMSILSIKTTSPKEFAPSIPRTFVDGTSNTIIFTTKFANCGDGGSRYAAEPDSKFSAFFGQNAAKKPAHPTDETATFQVIPDPRKECRIAPLMPQSFHKNGIDVGMADGSVRRVSASLSAETWNRAMQPNDGKALGADWLD